MPGRVSVLHFFFFLFSCIFLFSFSGSGGSLTDFSDDTGYNQLFLAGGLDGGAEFGIVPGVDLALAVDESRVGVHVHDFLEHETVGAGVGGGSEDSGQIEDVAESCMAEDVVAEVVGVVITHDLSEADLGQCREGPGMLLDWDLIVGFCRWRLESDLQRRSCSVCSRLAREWRLRAAGLL